MSTTVYTMSELRTTSSVSSGKRFSKNSNTAGGPLPLIPRRVPSAPRVTPSASLSESAPNTPTPTWTSPKITEPSPTDRQAQFPFPPPGAIQSTSEDSETGGSSNGSDPCRLAVTTPKIRRVRGQRMPSVRAPENSTPTPAIFEASCDPPNRRHPSTESAAERDIIADTSETVTPRPSHTVQSRAVRPPAGSLRLNITAAQRHHSASHLDFAHRGSVEEAPIQIPPSVEARLVRKKSGQPVKSSLKSSKASERGSLSIFTRGVTSKSEPTTPTGSKAVHFDSQLEHVKLFIAEQKPLAVSRDGSPTDDTSGTDTDFPSFIYGGADGGRPRKALLMKMNNMPPSISPGADVALENMTLSSDMMCISGNIRVRNHSFQKWVAVRFTFDNWQTTSEVAGKYVESLNGGSVDRFAFSIRLTDMLARIEEKTLLLAIRYSIEGREMWDNNRGLNYNATFTKSKTRPKTSIAKSDDESAGSDFADLTSKLEKVALGRGPPINQSQARSVVPPSDQEKPPALKEGVSLASRYDFGTSSKSPWKPNSFPVPPPTNRSLSHPSASSVPWPQKAPVSVKIGINKTRPMLNREDSDSLGSPRDLEDSRLRMVVQATSDPEDLPFPISNPFRVVRNHQRGYFDPPTIGDASGVRRTPPGTPIVAAFGDSDELLKPQKLFPFPQMDSAKLGAPVTERGGSRLDLFSFGSSEDSTPSTMSPANSSRSSSPSPSPSPTELFMAQLSSQPDCVSPSADYMQLLNKFCFFTGSVDLPLSPLEGISRASSPEVLQPMETPRFNTPSRKQLSTFGSPTTPSQDENAARSGSSTPTPRSFVGSATPVPA